MKLLNSLNFIIQEVCLVMGNWTEASAKAVRLSPSLGKMRLQFTFQNFQKKNLIKNERVENYKCLGVKTKSTVTKK